MGKSTSHLHHAPPALSARRKTSKQNTHLESQSRSARSTLSESRSIHSFHIQTHHPSQRQAPSLPRCLPAIRAECLTPSSGLAQWKGALPPSRSGTDRAPISSGRMRGRRRAGKISTQKGTQADTLLAGHQQPLELGSSGLLLGPRRRPQGGRCDTPVKKENKRGISDGQANVD